MFGGTTQTRHEAELYFDCQENVPRSAWPTGVNADALIWSIPHPARPDQVVHVWLEHRLAVWRACLDLYMEWALGEGDDPYLRLLRYRNLREWMDTEHIGAPDWLGDDALPGENARKTVGEYCTHRYGRELLWNVIEPRDMSDPVADNPQRLVDEFWPAFRIRVAAILKVAGAATPQQIWERHTPDERREIEASLNVQGRRRARRFTHTYFAALMRRRLSSDEEARILRELPTFLSWSSDAQMSALVTYGLSLDLSDGAWLQSALLIRSAALLRSGHLVETRQFVPA